MYNARQYESALTCYEEQIHSSKATVALLEKQAMCAANLDDAGSITFFQKALNLQSTASSAASEVVKLRLLSGLIKVQRQHKDDTAARSSLKTRLELMQRKWELLVKKKRTTSALHEDITQTLQHSAAWALEQQDMVPSMEYFREHMQFRNLVPDLA